MISSRQFPFNIVISVRISSSTGRKHVVCNLSLKIRQHCLGRGRESDGLSEQDPKMSYRDIFTRKYIAVFRGAVVKGVEHFVKFVSQHPRGAGSSPLVLSVGI